MKHMIFWLQSAALSTLTVSYTWAATRILWLTILEAVACLMLVLLVRLYGGAFPTPRWARPREKK